MNSCGLAKGLAPHCPNRGTYANKGSTIQGQEDGKECTNSNGCPLEMTHIILFTFHIDKKNSHMATLNSGTWRNKYLSWAQKEKKQKS